MSQSPISLRYVDLGCSVPSCELPIKSRYHGTPLCKAHFSQQYMRDRRSKPIDPRYFLGAYGEAEVRDILLKYGRHIQDQPSKCKFDFLVDGYRVEVKTVNPFKHWSNGAWLINIQRNGKLDEDTDFYIFRLEGYGDPHHALFPAPIGKKGMYLRIGTKKLRYACADFEDFIRGVHVTKKRGDHASR